jgi:hypothetical protein
MADAAGVYLDANLASLRFGYLALHELKVAAGLGNLHGLHSGHGILL